MLYIEKNVDSFSILAEFDREMVTSPLCLFSIMQWINYFLQPQDVLLHTSFILVYTRNYRVWSSSNVCVATIICVAGMCCCTCSLLSKLLALNKARIELVGVEWLWLAEMALLLFHIFELLHLPTISNLFLWFITLWVTSCPAVLFFWYDKIMTKFLSFILRIMKSQFFVYFIHHIF